MSDDIVTRAAEVIGDPFEVFTASDGLPGVRARSAQEIAQALADANLLAGPIPGDVSERPKWTKEIQRFLGDTIIDEKYGYPMDGSGDELLEHIEEAVNTILCDTFGHQVEDDMCGIPEHRYCVWCQRRESEFNSVQQQ